MVVLKAHLLVYSCDFFLECLGLVLYTAGINRYISYSKKLFMALNESCDN